MEERKTMNDLQKEQTNNDTMCSTYSLIKKIIAKCTIRAPNPGEKRYARLSERKGRNVPYEAQWASN